MRILLLVVLILAGCANPNFDAGVNSFNTGDYWAARGYFGNCVNQTGDPACMNNAGVSAERTGDMESAKRWFTLGASKGNADAIANLNRLGWPVPAAGYAQPGLLQSIGQGLGTAAGGLSDDVYRQQRGLPPAAPAKQLDSACWLQCIDVYSPPFCKSKCSY